MEPFFGGTRRTPFLNKRNACKRLIRYHVFHELEPSADELQRHEDELETKAQHLLTKFQHMINKYHHLLLMVRSRHCRHGCTEFHLVLLGFYLVLPDVTGF